MNWRRLLPLLNLLFILVELCDPTTPFIRISSEPAATKHAIAVASNQVHNEGHATPHIEKADKKLSLQLEKRSVVVGDCHDAIGSIYLTLPKFTLKLLRLHMNTGLKNQYDPDGLIRPPIALIA
jgi:hypothetical protein